MFNRKDIIILLLILFVGALIKGSPVLAQDVIAKANIDTNQIRIGEQITYTLNVQSNKDVKLLWPTFLDTIYHFEVVDRSAIDSINVSGNNYELEQSFILTNFDSGYYPIPPIRFDYKLPNDNSIYSAETEPLLVAVNTVAVDTAATIKDIKPPIHVPVSFKEMVPYIISVFGLFALIVIAIVLYRKYKNKQDGIIEDAPIIPAHVVAFEQLQKLNNDKLWQQGKIKTYYSGLSDIVRLYIENRYRTPALEMTTDEILSSGLINSISIKESEELERILRTSDLAKFAKSNPLPKENELNWQLAYEFVDKTKEIEIETVSEPKQKEVNVE